MGLRGFQAISIYGLVLGISLLGFHGFAAEKTARGSRKIPHTYKRYEDPTNKKADPKVSEKTADTTGSATATAPSIAAYTPAGSPVTPAASTGVDKKDKNKQPLDLSSILSALGGGGGGGAGSPGDGSGGAGGDPGILNAPANTPYNPSGSNTDSGFTPAGPAPRPNLSGSTEDYGPEVHGTDYSKASCGLTQSTWVTHYGSDASQYGSAAEAKLEGGEKDRHGRKLNSVEESIKNGRPVSLAGDKDGEFGRRCNQSPTKACLMLVCYEKFDEVFPEYRARFPGVQKNCLIGAIVDTGGAFYGSNGGKIDVATRSITKARTISGAGRYYEIQTDTCKKGVGDKRDCVVNNIQAACVPEGSNSGTGNPKGQGSGRQ